LVAYFTIHMIPLPGDLLARGTPLGVGFGKNRFMAVGAVLECGIANLGAQRHEISACCR
jgi:2,4-didehydro-3-deoxy-L-rhamnonate hydrolase